MKHVRGSGQVMISKVTKNYNAVSRSRDQERATNEFRCLNSQLHSANGLHRHFEEVHHNVAW